MIHFFDTSAIAKVILDERESAALRAQLRRWSGDSLVSSQLMATELHRLARRLGVPPETVNVVISMVDLVDMERDDFVTARTLNPSQARTLDVLHVAVASRLSVDTFVTYDERQAEAATAQGLVVSSPR